MAWKGKYLLVILLSIVVNAKAQTATSVIGQRDTSFSASREYEKLRKDFTGIKLVTYAPSPLVREKRNIVYCKTGSRQLLLDAFVPAAKSKELIPAILFMHGGGWRSGNKEQHHPLAQKLAERGYACFTPEYRLSPEARYPAAVYDLKAALRWIHANAGVYGIDTNRIAVAGFSAGGQLAALLGTTIGNPLFDGNTCHKGRSDKVQAIIDLDGILAFIHPDSGEGDDSKKPSAATTWFGYGKQEKPELWKQASALTYAGPRTPPTLFVNSSVARMHAGREDYRNILDAFTICSQVKTFTGAPHSFPLFQPWFDSTLQMIDTFLKRVFRQNRQDATTILVAQDGSGHYKTVQAAFDAIPVNNTKPVVIYVKNGIYKEKLFLDSTKPFVTLIGEDKHKTILTYDDHTGKISPRGDTINTYTSHSFLAAASDFTAHDITFQNTAGFSAGQAVAIQVLGDRSSFFNCRFTGNQDVLFPSRPHTRQYFQDCYIEGTTDFIFGPSTAWFERCHIHSKKNSHITAASTPREAEFGYVFNDCVLTGDTALRNVSLGRPWRAYADVVYLNTYIGPHIRPEGWSVWNKNDNHLTTTYAEYNNYGPSSGTGARLDWTKQLTAEEVKKYNQANVLKDWDPLNHNQ